MGQSLDRKKSQLRRQLGTDRVLTTVQIERLGLTTAVEALDLPMLTLTSRTRITQPHSNVDLTYVALTPALLERSQRELMHDAGTAEACRRSGLTGGHWQHASGEEQMSLPLRVNKRGRLRLPDAHYSLPQENGVDDWAIEFDAGYHINAIEAKLRDADQVGYSQYLWATTVRARTDAFGPFIHTIQRQQPLQTMRRVDVIYVNFWSRKDPYIQSSRNHKALRKTYTFSGAVDE